MTIRSACFLFAVLCCLTSCVAPDTRHRIVISIPQQRMALLDNDIPLTTFSVSTSKFAIGDWPGSRATPLGELEIAKKITGWAIANLRSPDGYFYYQRRRFYTVHIPYMRWSEAWMAYGLARLLEVNSEQ